MQEQEGGAGPGGGCFPPMQEKWGFAEVRMRRQAVAETGAAAGRHGVAVTGSLVLHWRAAPSPQPSPEVDQPGYAQLLPGHKQSENEANTTFRGVSGIALSWRKLQAFRAEIASQLNKTQAEAATRRESQGSDHHQTRCFMPPEYTYTERLTQIEQGFSNEPKGWETVSALLDGAGESPTSPVPPSPSPVPKDSQGKRRAARTALASELLTQAA